MFLGNAHMPISKCWNRNYLPRPSPPLVHGTLTMLNGTQMVSLCALYNHSFDYSQILDLKNKFQGLPLTIRPLDFYLLNVLEQQMAFGKHG